MVGSAHITGMRAFLGSAQGTGEEKDTLRALRSLQTGLAAVLEGQSGGATTKSACETVLEHPKLLPLLLGWVATDAHENFRDVCVWALVCKQLKDLARQDKLWHRVKEGLLNEDDERKEGQALASIAAYGRCLIETPLVMTLS